MLTPNLDEKVRAIAALQIPQCEEDVLKSLLSRAEFKIEVWAFDRATQDERTRSLVEPAKDLVYATTVSKLDDPIVLVQQKDEDLAETVFVLVWELEFTLHRPRFRMQDPLVAVHSAFLVSTSSPGDAKSGTYLEPFQLQEPNVFEPMRNMPGLQGKAPYLAASRLERVRPENPQSQKQFRVEHMSSSYRMVAVAITRMKYTRLNTPTALPTLIASLDIEIIPILEVKVVIETADLTMLNGRVESLMPKILPMECRSRDLISLLFRLFASSNPQQAASPLTPGSFANVDVLSLSLSLKLKISESCQPAISMSWTTNVDFFQSLNPAFGAPNQPMQRTHRPSSLALQNGNGNRQASQSIGTSLQPVLNTATANQVTISFTAPASPIEIGKPFAWTMLIINNSLKPTKLAIIPLPRIPRGSNQTTHFTKRHAPKSSTASFQPAERRHTRDKRNTRHRLRASSGGRKRRVCNSAFEYHSVWNRSNGHNGGSTCWAAGAGAVS